MPSLLDSLEHYYAPSRAHWRQWLADNHTSQQGVWLIYYKKSSGVPSLTYDEAVEEALCFGWIDSKPNTIDEQSYKQLFSPRNPKSVWSKLNKTRIEKLIADGLMAEAGLQKIEIAKQNGTWTALDAVEALTIPEDLDDALVNNPKAKQYFDAFPPSAKKAILWWIESAKRPETRLERINRTVADAAQNIRANQYTNNK